MKTPTISLLILTFLLTLGCGRPVSRGPLRTYAVLPFDVRIEKNLQFKKTTVEQLRQQEEREAYQYQNGVFQYLMTKQKDFSVSFQDIDDTNTLLKRKSLAYGNLRSMTKRELCQALGVDGIISGRFQRKENLDRTAARALDFVTSETGLFALNVKQSEANLSLSLYNNSENQVVWTYQNDDWNSSYRSPEDMAQNLMARAARKFPYKK